MNSGASSLRGAFLRGVAWNAGYQAFASALQFGAMLVVVRIVPPEEYGQWAVTLGILQLLNALNIATFLSHALQLQRGDEPDWTLHWHAGNVFQVGLFVLCTCIAVAARASENYQNVGTLLHIASVGVLVNTPAQMRMVMLQRRLDFHRMRTITAVSSLLGAGSIVLGALLGYGARGIVLGGNVVVAIPFIIDLLVVERWRPEGTWFAWPDLVRYRDSLVFGANRAGASLLASSRGALSAALLPATLGFGAIGLMNRAESLFAMSAGRVLGLVSETMYPILPQISGEEERFARVARGYTLIMSSMVLAAVGLFAVCARDLSRILYGAKWAEADPLLLPGSVIGLAATLATVGGQILLAKGRLREVFILDLVPRVLLVPAFIGVVAFEWNVVTFCWGVAIPLALTAFIGLFCAGRRLPLGTLSGALVGPGIASGVASLGAILTGWAVAEATPGLRCSVQIPVFCLAWILLLRYAFPGILVEILALAPGGAKLAKLLGTSGRQSRQ